MRATFDFDMNDPDDKMAHLRATKSLDLALAVWQIIHNTKKGLMYQVESALSEDKNLTPYDAVDMVYDRIYEILEEHNIKIDELIN